MPRKSVKKGKKKFPNKGKKVIKTMGVKTMGVPGVAARTGGFRAGFGSAVGEKKTIDVIGALQGVNFNQAGVITLLNGVAQGTDYNARIGRKIVMASIYIRGSIYIEATWNKNVNSIIPSQTARLILIYDMQTNGTAPVLTDILNTAGTEIESAQLNLNNRDRFKILKDKCFAFDACQTDANGGILGGGMHTDYCFKIYKKLKMETIFGGTDASTGSIVSGALWLLTVGSQPAGATDVNASITSRIRFMDP